MVGEQDVHLQLDRHFRHAPRRRDVGLEARHVLAEIEGGATPQHGAVHGIAPLHVEYRREGA